MELLNLSLNAMPVIGANLLIESDTKGLATVTRLELALNVLLISVRFITIDDWTGWFIMREPTRYLLITKLLLIHVWLDFLLRGIVVVILGISCATDPWADLFMANLTRNLCPVSPIPLPTLIPAAFSSQFVIFLRHIARVFICIVMRTWMGKHLSDVLNGGHAIERCRLLSSRLRP